MLPFLLEVNHSVIMTELIVRVIWVTKNDCYVPVDDLLIQPWNKSKQKLKHGSEITSWVFYVMQEVRDDVDKDAFEWALTKMCSYKFNVKFSDFIDTVHSEIKL